MPQFPLILIPPAIERLKEEQPPLPYLSKPQRPIPPSPPKPLEAEPQRIDQDKIVTNAVLYLFFSLILGFFANSMLPTIGLGIAIVTFLGLIGKLAYETWQEVQNFPIRLYAYKQKQKVHIQQQQWYQNALEQLPSLERQYEEDFQQYLQEYKQLKAETHSRENVRQFQHQRLRQILNETTPHDGSGSRAKRGESEASFGQYLKQYFFNKIHTGLTLEIPGFEHPYTADFAYIDSSFNLFIDIEVDEPYVYGSKKPTHYLGGKKDERRNEFFLDRLWSVIRFSEEQVVRYPKSCCKVVAQAIAEITLDQSILTQFSSVPDLKPMKQWTEQEAIQMADKDYRNTYL